MVVRDVGPGIEEGESMTKGDFWCAKSVNDGIFKRDEHVFIEHIDGTLVYVRSLGEYTEAGL